VLRKVGWWAIGSGQTLLLWNVDLRTVNRYAYYEAELEADATVWGGSGNAWTEITDNAFNQGFLDQAGCNRWVDYQELDFKSLVDLLGLNVTILLSNLP